MKEQRQELYFQWGLIQKSKNYRVKDPLFKGAVSEADWGLLTLQKCKKSVS